MAARLLGLGIRPEEVNRQLQERYGTSWEMGKIYIAKGRELNVTWSGKSKEYHFSFAANVARALLADPKTQPKDRLAAVKLLAQLYGLLAPKSVKMVLEEDGFWAVDQMLNERQKLN